MVQILPEAPNFSSQMGRGLGSALARGLGSGVKSLFQSRANSREDEAVKRLTGMDVSGLSPDLKSEFVKKFTPQKNTSGQTAQKSFDSLVDLVNKGNVGRGSGIGSFFGHKEVAHDTGRFKSAMAGLESGLREMMVGTGRMTDTQFNFLTEKIMPKPGETLDEMQGKLEEIGLLLGVEPESLERLSEANTTGGFRGKSGAVHSSRSSNNVRMQSPDGRIVVVPKSQVKAAMSAGGKVVR